MRSKSREVLLFLLFHSAIWNEVYSGRGVYIGGGSDDCSDLHKSADHSFNDPVTGTCYYVYHGHFKHNEALTLCENEGTRVVELGSKLEQDWLIENVRHPGLSPSMWLGLLRQSSGVWNWIYKTRKWPVDSPRWTSTSLSSVPGYRMAVTAQGGQWQAVTDSETADVVCEDLRPEDLKTSPTPQPVTTLPPPQPVTTSPKKSVPSSCPKVGREAEDMAISVFKRLSIKVLVTELNESPVRRGTRVDCAKRCSQRRQCAMFVKEDNGACFLYRISDSGVTSPCGGNPSVCYWKSCWIPGLDVIA